MTPTPTITRDPQRQMALDKANEVRLARAELKRRIARGETTAAEIILAPPDEVSSWSVGKLLMSQRRWGNQRCRRFLESNEISELKLIGKLTDRQRQLLAQQLATCSALGSPPIPELQFV
ncbi:MAG TPA: hypothetical protein VG223_10410 [Solirubrobacteraceae bacterium]|jgi:hypothetical protein|nr:hypothetical protein [Solirubrobacteraceae bacterium]